MATTGRVPKPKLVALPIAQPKPRSVKLIAPSWLDPRTQAKWDEIAQHVQLVPLATLSVADSITSYSIQWCTYIDMVDALRSSGEYVSTSASGTVKASPLVAAIQRQAGILRGLADDLCMTPSSIARISSGTTSFTTDELDDFLSIRTG